MFTNFEDLICVFLSLSDNIYKTDFALEEIVNGSKFILIYQNKKYVSELITKSYFQLQWKKTTPFSKRLIRNLMKNGMEKNAVCLFLFNVIFGLDLIRVNVKMEDQVLFVDGWELGVRRVKSK